MKKSIPVLILMVMIAMLTISWKNTLEYKSNIRKEYNTHITNAQEYEKKKIYVDAAAEYEKALEIKPKDYETAMKIVEMYEYLEDDGSFLTSCENAIKANPKKLEPYLLIADHYMENNSNRNAYSILMKAKKQIKSKEITKRLIELKGKYSLSTIDGEVFPYHYDEKSGEGYSIYIRDNKKGIMNTSGSAVIKGEYDEIGMFSDYVAPVKSDGEYYYVNSKGYRKLVPDDKADYLGPFGGGYAPISIKGVYGYIDKKMKLHEMEYSYTGAFYNGVAAVEKDGKWGVINTSFENVTKMEFDDILIDGYGFCSTQGVFFAKKDGKYYLYDLTGNALSDGYDDAKMFASDEPAAVKKDGKWGFISKDGKLVIKPEYPDADSFSGDYAPIMDESGKWGCIDSEQNVVIKPFLDELAPFDRRGYALCKENGIKKYLVINLYDQE